MNADNCPQPQVWPVGAWLTVPVRRRCLTLLPLTVLTVTVLAVTVLAVTAPAATAQTETAERSPGSNAVLHWTSGDSLPGRLTRVNAEHVTWESGLFAEPLQLERSVLASVQFMPTETPASTSDEFRIALTTNDVLFGAIRSLDEQTLDLDSSRHGQISIPRRRIAGIERINQDALIYLGPAGLDDWPDADVRGEWSEETDGSLRSTAADATLSRALPDQSLLAIEVILDFDERPEFMMALGGSNEEDSLRLVTWDDALVAFNGVEFLELQMLDEGPSTIHVLLYADLSTGRMTVCTPQGEVLAKLTTLEPKQIPERLWLQNGSSRVVLQHLRIHRWNGTTVGSLVPGRTGLQLNNGDVRYGNVVSISDGTVTVAGDDGSLRIPLQEIGSLEISDQVPQETDDSDTAPVRMKWRDGGVLHGEIQEVTPTEALLRPIWSEVPIIAARQGIQQIRFSGGLDVPAGPDELIMGGRLLHGHLVVDAGRYPITWRPTGAIRGVPLQSGDNAVVERSSKTKPVMIDAEEFPDTVYLRNNDIIPCRLDSITEQDVELSSPFATATRFPSDAITAVELSATRRGSDQGFADNSWKRINGKIRKDGDAVTLISGRFGSEHGMSGDRLSFRMEWPAQKFIFVTVRLFASDLHDPRTASSCTFLLSENNVIVTEDLDRRNPFAALQHQRGRIHTKDRSADVQLVTSQGTLDVVVNGQSARQIPLKREGAGSSGVVFELVNAANGRFFGGRAVVGAGNDKQNQLQYLKLSRLHTGPLSGVAIQRFIDEETRRHALTIPRFRRDNPPTHALIAPNGDVLRGRLIGIHTDAVEFESRLEVFRFPRERVSAVIWIGDPAQPQGTDESETTTDVESIDATVLQTVLAGGFLVSMTPDELSDGQLHGVSSTLGECHVPAAAISRLYLGDPALREKTSAWSHWRARHAVEPDWDIATSDGGRSAASEMIGLAAPDFELPQLDGETFRLSQHAGRVVVLDFWASWCGPCVAALPDYIEATNFFDESDLVFVAVNIDESPQQIRAFLAEHEMDLRVAIDAGSETAAAYQVNGIPHSLIISPEGTIEWVHVGYDPDAGDEVRRVAESILSGTWNRDADQPTSDSPRP